MKNRVVSLLLAAAVFAACSTQVMALDREYMKGFALGKAIELCDLVVLGRISAVEGVWRDNIDVNITTDITVEVEKVILGTPNASKTKVKFMVRGGKVRNPNTGTTQTMIASNMPYTRFEVGQRAMFFLYAGKDDELYAGYPHGRYQLLHGMYGRRLITENRLSMYYLPSRGNQFKVVEFPIELASKLGEAFVADKDAASTVEALIKSRVDRGAHRKIRLPEATVEDLTERSKRIIKTAASKK